MRPNHDNRIIRLGECFHFDLNRNVQHESHDHQEKQDLEDLEEFLTPKNTRKTKKKRSRVSKKPDVALTVFIRECAEKAQDQNNIDEEDHLKWRSPLFNFIRLLITNRHFKGITGIKALEIIKREIGDTWLRDFGFLFKNEEGSEIELIVTWTKVKVPAGYDPLNIAIELANMEPISFPTCGENQFPNLKKLLSIAFHLDSIVDSGDPIMLPVCRLGSVLFPDLSKVAGTRRVSRIIEFSINLGHIKKIRASEYSPGSFSKAAEYKFLSRRGYSNEK